MAVSRKALKEKTQARLRAKNPMMAARAKFTWVEPTGYDIEVFIGSLSNPFNEIKMTNADSVSHSDMVLRKMFTPEEVAITYAKRKINYGSAMSKFSLEMAELVGSAIKSVTKMFKTAPSSDNLVEYDGPCPECGGKIVWDARLVNRIMKNLNAKAGQAVTRHAMNLPPVKLARLKGTPNVCMGCSSLSLANFLHKHLPVVE